MKLCKHWDTANLGEKLEYRWKEFVSYWTLVYGGKSWDFSSERLALPGEAGDDGCIKATAIIKVIKCTIGSKTSRPL